MPDTQELIKQARQLGEQLAANPVLTAYLEAQRAIRKDDEARRILENYRRAAQEVAQREANGMPIEPEHKRQLVEGEKAMASQATLKLWMRTQTDYMHLMNQVNQAMEEPIARRMQTASGEAPAAS